MTVHRFHARESTALRHECSAGAHTFERGSLRSTEEKSLEPLDCRPEGVRAPVSVKAAWSHREPRHSRRVHGSGTRWTLKKGADHVAFHDRLQLADGNAAPGAAATSPGDRFLRGVSRRGRPWAS